MMACCINPVHGQNKIGSIGMPLPDVDARIVDAENPAQEMTTGEVGELILRAPQLMLEHWNNPLETAETLRAYDAGERWLHTGDLAYMDGGRLHLHRRSQERHDEDERLPGVAARDRGGHRRSSGGPRSGRGRRARRRSRARWRRRGWC